jgi:thiol-disulfide isomerase/thioredoxin
MIRLVSILSITAALMWSPVAGQDVGLPLGSEAPVVQLEDLEGNPVDIGQWIGERPILLEFWASWCPICAKLEPKMEAAYERYGDRVEFVIIAVAVNQNKTRVSKHMERAEIPYNALWDGRGQAVRSYSVQTTGVIVIVDADGRIAYTGVGEDQDLDAALIRVTGG